MYSFKCGEHSKNKLKGISKSQSSHIKFEEYYNCLFGGEYQKECDNYIIRSLNHEMILQKVKKSTLSIFDDKRCYINNIESIPWNWKSCFYWKRFFISINTSLINEWYNERKCYC